MFCENAEIIEEEAVEWHVNSSFVRIVKATWLLVNSRASDLLENTVGVIAATCWTLDVNIAASVESFPAPTPICGPQHFWRPREKVCQLQRDFLMLHASFVCHVLLETDYDVQFFTAPFIFSSTFLKTYELKYEDIFH